MKLLHNIGDRKFGSNYNDINEILGCKDDISFDGIYANVLNESHNLKIIMGRKKILFVMGKYVGGNNSFDDPKLPRESLATWDEVQWLAKEIGAEIGYHSWSHPNLTTVSDEELELEVRKPADMPFPIHHFAYPYGNVDARVVEAVKRAGYLEAWSVHQGDGSRFQRRRSYLNW